MENINEYLADKYNKPIGEIDQLIEDTRLSKLKELVKDLKYLGEFLNEIVKSCNQQYESDGFAKVTGSVSIKTKFLEEVSRYNKEEQIENYLKDRFFLKSVDSIKNKIFRKLSSGEDVSLKEFDKSVSDLFRDSIICSNYNLVRMFVNRLKGDFKSYLPKKRDADGKPTEEIYGLVDKIQVDDESKMNNGYFAYHVQIFLKSGLSIEIQVFSELTSQWRDISHRLYEKQRIGKEVRSGAGEASTRLISLGHTLHIIDCEIQRLIDELKNEFK